MSMLTGSRKVGSTSLVDSIILKYDRSKFANVIGLEDVRKEEFS